MKKINVDIINYVINNYSILSIKEIVENTKISKSTITKIAKNNNIELKSAKKYLCDEFYFENINKDDKSYWLGFLFADGYVRMYKGRSAELRLKLSILDKNHIELFKNTIKSTHPIKDIDSALFYNNKKSISKCSTFSINNKKIVTDLFKIGCVNKKSMIINFPDINKEYFRHFIRGYFDGDGCIYTNSNRNDLTFTSGSLIFLEQIQKIFNNELNINVNICKYKNTYKLYICNRKDIFKVYEFFYKNSSIFLERKKKKFDSIFNVNF